MSAGSPAPLSSTRMAAPLVLMTRSDIGFTAASLVSRQQPQPSRAYHTWDEPILRVNRFFRKNRQLCTRDRRERLLPLTKAIFAFVLAKLRPLPALAAVAGEIYPGYAAVAAEGNAASEPRGTRLQPLTRHDVGDEGARYHSVDRHRLEPRFSRPHARMRRIRNGVGGLHPVVGIRMIKHLDVVKHLDPVRGVPTRHDQPQREAVEQRKLLAVHRVGEHDLAIARVVDSERFHQFRCLG